MLNKQQQKIVLWVEGFHCPLSAFVNVKLCDWQLVLSVALLLIVPQSQLQRRADPCTVCERASACAAAALGLHLRLVSWTKWSEIAPTHLFTREREREWEKKRRVSTKHGVRCPATEPLIPPPTLFWLLKKDHPHHSLSSSLSIQLPKYNVWRQSFMQSHNHLLWLCFCFFVCFCFKMQFDPRSDITQVLFRKVRCEADRRLWVDHLHLTCRNNGSKKMQLLARIQKGCWALSHWVKWSLIHTIKAAQMTHLLAGYKSGVFAKLSTKLKKKY